jgi:hypothetical protein
VATCSDKLALAKPVEDSSGNGAKTAGSGDGIKVLGSKVDVDIGGCRQICILGSQRTRKHPNTVSELVF